MFLVCGEALFDFFMTGEESGSLSFEARMGGSPYNVAIGLARLGIRAGLFTGISKDFLGNRLARSLVAEGVATDFIVEKDSATTLSLVALGAGGVPSYAFYGQNCADRSLERNDIPILPEDTVGLHFGSYSLVVEPTASTFLELGQREHARRLISVDPNVRLTVEPRIDVWRQRLSTWLALAHIVKVSCEDLETLYPGVDPAELARSWLDQGTRLVVITKGDSGAVAVTQRSVVEVPARPVAVVDTVGAGDAFQAALLHSLLARGRATPKALAALEAVELREILTFAVMAAAIACSRGGADLPTAADVQAAVWESTAA